MRPKDRKSQKKYIKLHAININYIIIIFALCCILIYAYLVV
jgi:hypothetical protein